MDILSGVIGPVLLFVFALVFGGLWIFGWSSFIVMLFSEKVAPGEVIASYRRGSRRIERLYGPGRYWRIPRPHVVWLRVRVDQPVDFTSRPVEARTYDNASVIVTVRLASDVAVADRYGRN